MPTSEPTNVKEARGVLARVERHLAPQFHVRCVAWLDTIETQQQEIARLQQALQWAPQRVCVGVIKPGETYEESQIREAGELAEAYAALAAKEETKG